MSDRGRRNVRNATASSLKAQGLQIKRRRAQPEAALQRAVFQHLQWRAPRNAFYFHPANGGLRSRIEAGILVGLGVVAGIPDVIIIYDGRVFALELKSADGRLTPAQLHCHERLRAAGAVVGVAAGIDAALEWLTAHGLLRGAAQ